MSFLDDKKIDEIKYYVNLGNVNFLQENFYKTIEYFDKALELDPNFDYLTPHDVFYFLGESYRKLNQLDLAKKYLEQALIQFEPAKGKKAIWHIYLALARALQETPKHDSTKWMPYYFKVVETLVPKSKGFWLSWLKAVPTSQEMTEGLLEAYYYIGLHQLLKGEYDDATCSLTEAINSGSQKQPLFSQAHFFLGRSYLLNDDNKKAIKIFQKLMKVDPKFQWVDEASVYYDIGQAYYKEQKYQQSLEYKLKILEMTEVEPDLLAQVHLGLGHTYHSLNIFERAVEHYKECIKLTDPKSPIRRTAIEYLVDANEALASGSS